MGQKLWWVFLSFGRVVGQGDMVSFFSSRGGFGEVGLGVDCPDVVTRYVIYA